MQGSSQERSTPVVHRKLYPGDTIEYSVSQELPTKGASTWVKAGATTTIQAGEKTIAASKRLVDFVNDLLESEVQNFLAE